MPTASVAITLIAVATNGFSGIAALLHFRPILPGMAKAGVPESWLTFPIGTLKTAGALGLAVGLYWWRAAGVARPPGTTTSTAQPDGSDRRTDLADLVATLRRTKTT